MNTRRVSTSPSSERANKYITGASESAFCWRRRRIANETALANCRFNNEDTSGKSRRPNAARGALPGEREDSLIDPPTPFRYSWKPGRRHRDARSPPELHPRTYHRRTCATQTVRGMTCSPNIVKRPPRLVISQAAISRQAGRRTRASAGPYSEFTRELGPMKLFLSLSFSRTGDATVSPRCANVIDDTRARARRHGGDVQNDK